jgi:hypothetical protein
MRSQGCQRRVSGAFRINPLYTDALNARPQSPLGARAARFWLPIVDPLFHGSFGRRLARDSFEPYGLVATAIRVSPPHGEVIPSIETNPDLVLASLDISSLPPFYNPLIQDGWSSLTRHQNPSRGVLASVREKLHPILTTSRGSRDCHGGGGTRHIKPLPRRGRPCYKPCSLVYRFSASALWRCFTALISSRQTLLNGVNAGIK